MENGSAHLWVPGAPHGEQINASLTDQFCQGHTHCRTRRNLKDSHLIWPRPRGQ